MRIKTILIALILAASVSAASAQQKPGLGLGVKAGLNFSDLTSTSGNVRTGLHAGLFTDYYFSKNFGLELGLYYSQQGNLDNLDTRDRFNTGRTDYIMNYFSVPLTVNYRIFNSFRIFAGPQMGIVLESRLRPDLNNFNFVTRNTEWSGIAGVGFTFGIGLDLSASYTFGFTDVFDTPDFRTSYTSMYRVSLGWRFLKFLK